MWSESELYSCQYCHNMLLIWPVYKCARNHLSTPVWDAGEQRVFGRLATQSSGPFCGLGTKGAQLVSYISTSWKLWNWLIYTLMHIEKYQPANEGIPVILYGVLTKHCSDCSTPAPKRLSACLAPRPKKSLLWTRTFASIPKWPPRIKLSLRSWNFCRIIFGNFAKSSWLALCMCQQRRLFSLLVFHHWLHILRNKDMRESKVSEVQS